jgi:hypothetical protein
VPVALRVDTDITHKPVNKRFPDFIVVYIDILVLHINSIGAFANFLKRGETCIIRHIFDQLISATNGDSDFSQFLAPLVQDLYPNFLVH